MRPAQTGSFLHRPPQRTLPSRRLQPLGVACWAWLAFMGCGNNKADSAADGSPPVDDGAGDDGTGAGGTGDDGTGSGSDDGSSGTGSDDGGSGSGGGTDGVHPYFTRVYNDVLAYGDLRTTATLNLTAGADGLTGTVSYTETVVASETTICNSTLNVVRVASDPDCTDCEWGFTFFLEPDTNTRTDGCVFASPTTSFGLGDGGYLGTLAKRAEGPASTRNVVTLGTRNATLEYVAEHTLYAEDVEGSVLVDHWEPSTGAVAGVDFTSVAVGSHLWETCTIPESRAGETTTGPPTGGTEVNDSIDCSLGPGLVDVWEGEVGAGQLLSAAVDHSGDDSIMWLVDPKGCLLEVIDDSVACSDDRVLCPAISHTAGQDGTYRVVVGPLYCLNTNLNYFFDGSIL
ncbi:MAG: hypothetical protein CL927_02590 [Deltaproteobacteria bacterium]|nr:hypothetical protein [Deltaproteobacteria bacterium]